MAATRKTGNITQKGIQTTSIQVKQVNRTTQDISKWRDALKSFESLTNPSRVKLYDLLDDILLDGQVEATWGKRQDYILNKDLLFVRDGEEDEQISHLLNCPDMQKIVKEIHNSIAWGYSLIQINSIVWDEDQEQYRIDHELIPRKHVHPERGYECVSIEQFQATRDFLYKEKPLSDYMIWVGEESDKGLLFKAAQYVIYKRGGFGDWAQFAEMFGMPFREMTYDDYDEVTRVKLEELLKNWGAFGYMVHPKGSELTLHDSQGSGSGSSVFKDLHDTCDAAISKTILGNTLTTEQGSVGSQALGKVHQDGENSKNKADEKFVLGILNTQIKACLKRFGFNTKGGNIWFASPDKDWLQLKVKWDVINGIAQMIPVDDDFIYEEFDIPKPKDYDKLKKEMLSKPIIPEKKNLTSEEDFFDFPPLD